MPKAQVCPSDIQRKDVGSEGTFEVRQLIPAEYESVAKEVADMLGWPNKSQKVFRKFLIEEFPQWAMNLKANLRRQERRYERRRVSA